MTRAEEYRHLAETVRGRARHERSPALRAEWEHLAEIYSQLAEQTDPNEPLDPVWGSGVSYLGWFTPLAMGAVYWNYQWVPPLFASR